MHLDNFLYKYYHKSDINGLIRKEEKHTIELLKHVRELALLQQETGREHM